MQAWERRGEAPQEEGKKRALQTDWVFSLPPSSLLLQPCMHARSRASACDSSYANVCVCARVRARVVLKRTAPAEQQQQHQQQAL